MTEKGLAAGANDHRSIFVLMAVEESDVSLTEKASISAAEGRSAQLVFEVIEHRQGPVEITFRDGEGIRN